MQNWRKVPEKSFETFVKALNKALANKEPFNFEKTILEFASLPFYGNYKLLRATENKRIVFFVYKSGVQNGDAEVTILDGTKESIYKANKQGPLLLGNNNVISYALFCLTYASDKKEAILDLSPEETLAPEENKNYCLNGTFLGKPFKIVIKSNGDFEII